MPKAIVASKKKDDAQPSKKKAQPSKKKDDAQQTLANLKAVGIVRKKDKFYCSRCTTTLSSSSSTHAFRHANTKAHAI
jgi:hypothetical protein